MRLVIATPLYPPEIGGPATYAKLLEEGLPKEGIEVELVKFSEVRRLPRIVRHYAYYRRVLAAARRADAILALDPVSVGLPVMKAAKKAGKPYVVKIVGDYAWEQGQQRFGITETLDEFVQRKRVPLPVRILRHVEKRVAERARRVIVPSEYLKGVITAWGIPADKIEVIYNAVPLDRLGAVPSRVSDLPRPLVVTAGRLVPWKHIDGVIDAIAAIPEASLAVIGDGPDRAKLEAYMHEKLAGRSVMTGLLSHADTLATLLASDAFVLNSSYEGLSHLLVEAQMLGVPTVATRAGGNPEVVSHEKSGLLVNIRDTAALTDALRTLLSDDGLRSRMRDAAKEEAKRFFIETMLAHTAEFLRSVV